MSAVWHLKANSRWTCREWCHWNLYFCWCRIKPSQNNSLFAQQTWIFMKNTNQQSIKEIHNINIAASCGLFLSIPFRPSIRRYFNTCAPSNISSAVLVRTFFLFFCGCCRVRLRFGVRVRVRFVVVFFLVRLVSGSTNLRAFSRLTALRVGRLPIKKMEDSWIVCDWPKRRQVQDPGQINVFIFIHPSRE